MAQSTALYKTSILIRVAIAVWRSVFSFDKSTLCSLQQLETLFLGKCRRFRALIFTATHLSGSHSCAPLISCCFFPSSYPLKVLTVSNEFGWFLTLFHLPLMIHYFRWLLSGFFGFSFVLDFNFCRYLLKCFLH